MKITGILSRQLFGELLRWCLSAWLILVLLFTTFEVLTESQYTQPEQWRNMLLIVALGIPQKLHDLALFGLVIGSSIFFSQLKRHGEYTIYLVSGFSMTRLLSLCMVVFALLAACHLYIGEKVIPASSQWQKELREKNPTQRIHRPVWLHEENHFLRIGRLFDNGSGQELSLFHFTDNELDQVLTAEKGYYRDGIWVLLNPKAKPPFQYTENTFQLETAFSPEVLQLYDQAQNLPLSAIAMFLLKLYYQDRQNYRQEAAFFSKIYNYLAILLFPLTALLLHRHSRSSAKNTLAMNVGLAFLLCLVFFFSREIFYQISSRLGWNPAWAYALPLLSFMAISLSFKKSSL